jgi:hypothetical protein
LTLVFIFWGCFYAVTEPEPATDCGDFVLFKKVLRNLPEVLFETSEKLGPDGCEYMHVVI